MRKWLILIVLLFCAIPAHATISVVQHKQNFCSGTCTSLAVPFTSNVTATNSLVAWCYTNLSASPFATPSDTLGNTWVRDLLNLSSSAVWRVASSAGGADTVTINDSSTNYLLCQIYEITPGSQSLITSDNTDGTSSSPSATTTGNANTGNLALSFIWVLGGTQPFTASWTLDQQQSGNFSLNSASSHTSATMMGALTSTYGIGVSSVPWGVDIVVYGPLVSKVRHKATVY